MKEIHGYKTFNKDRTNRYGRVFIEGKTYQVNDPPKFGNKGKGFHFCKRLEDTLRYFPAMEEEVAIAEVTSLGDYVEYDDEYYGYYDMYSTNKIKINHFLTREEIIKKYLDRPEHQTEDRVIRFLQGFRLTEKEKEMFRLAYAFSERIEQTISYYQDGDKDAYTREKPKQRLKGKEKKSIM